MSKKRICVLLALVLCAALVLASCGGGGENGGSGDDAPAASGALPTKALPEHWTAEDGGIVFDGQEWESWYLSDLTMNDDDFRFTADVEFSEGNVGTAALIVQAGDDHADCYVASVSAMTDQAELYKCEKGAQVQLGSILGLEEKSSYSLLVTVVDNHVAFFVDDQLVCSTGDAPDIGQGDALLSGKIGLYAGDSRITFKNAAYNVYAQGEVPAVTSLALTPSAGTVEEGLDAYINGWYTTVQYVSNDCQSVTIAPATPEGVGAVVIDAEGNEVTGPAALREGTNDFQIFTTLTGEDGASRRQLSYKLHIIRRGAVEYYAEPYRPVYHYSVKEGWANDPNGVMKLGDTWHFFYQAYPFGTNWGTMHWVHAESPDLIHWEEKGVAFYPNEYGSMFSGCAVLDKDNVSGLFGENGGVILYITGNGNGQRIIAAYSEDGDNWQYYRGRNEDGSLNGDDVLIDWRDDPVKSDAFRDPKVFKYQDKWFMVIAGGLLRIYSSTDLIHWSLESTYTGEPIESANAANLRVETECPDLVRLPIEGEDGYKWVLSYGGRRYQVGDFNNQSGKWEFVAESQVLPMNIGNDSYAAMTYYLGDSFNGDTQDRVIEVNWMNSWDYCNNVDDLSSNTRFNGVYNLNLEMSLVRDTNGNLVLKQKPVEEYAQHVFPEANTALNTTVTAADGEIAALEYTGDAYLLDVTVTPGQGTEKAGVWLRWNGERDGGERGVQVTYDFTSDTLTVDRSSLGGFSASVRFSAVVAEERADGSVTVHLYVDRSSVEAFSDNYTVACAAQIYPNLETNTGLAVFSQGGESSFDVTVVNANNMRAE